MKASATLNGCSCAYRQLLRHQSPAPESHSAPRLRRLVFLAVARRLLLIARRRCGTRIGCDEADGLLEIVIAEFG